LNIWGSDELHSEFGHQGMQGASGATGPIFLKMGLLFCGKKVRKISKRLLSIVLLLSFLMMAILPVAYALSGNDYDVTISITDKAASSSSALKFRMLDGSEPQGDWAPGMSMRSRVHLTNGNYFKSVTLANIGVWITNLDSEELTVFANNMYLIVKQGQDQVFGKTLYDGLLSGFLYQDGSTTYTGCNVDITLGAFGTADLEYILTMSENAGAEMQGLTANLDFYFNLNNIPPDNGGDWPVPAPWDGSGPPAPPFLLEKGEWYEDCIIALINHNIIIPEIDGEIRPDDLITRGEAAVLLGRALGLQEDKESKPIYLDKIPEQYLGYVNATTKAGIFCGYPLIIEALPGRVFKADSYITREELFCVMVRAYNTMPAGNKELDFIDKDEISDWALEDIKLGVRNNIIEGYPDKTFRPKQYMTRAEAFSLICRLQGYHAYHGVEETGGAIDGQAI